MYDVKPTTDEQASEEVSIVETIALQQTNSGSENEETQPSGDQRLSHIDYCFTRNEDGDAQLYAEANRSCICHDPKLGKYFIWRIHRWDEDISGHAYIAVEEVVKAYDEWRGSLDSKKEGLIKAVSSRINLLHTIARKKRIVEIASLGNSGVGITGDEWDKDPYLLGCGNGVIDLRTRKLSPGKPEQYIKTSTPVCYDEAARPPKLFLDFLNQVFAFMEPQPTREEYKTDAEYQTALDAHEARRVSHAPEMIDYLQRLLGSSLIGEQIEHHLVVLDGKGRNGKSTLVDVLSHVLGQYAGAIQPEMLLQQTRTSGSSNASPDILDLRGKRLVFASETSEGARMDTSKVKRLVGGDELVGRALYSNHMVRFKPGYTMFLITNNKPMASADDYALWERIRVISFKVSFVDNPNANNPAEKPIDKLLPKKLKEESSQILRWLVEGCLRYQAEGLKMPESMRQARDEYIKEVDVLGHFIEESCTVKDGLEIKASDLFLHYQQWCEPSGHKPMNSTVFGKKIKKRFKEKRKRDGLYYLGIDKHQ
jgi:putative DNA primase/helicase